MRKIVTGIALFVLWLLTVPFILTGIFMLVWKVYDMSVNFWSKLLW